MQEYEPASMEPGMARSGVTEIVSKSQYSGNALQSTKLQSSLKAAASDNTETDQDSKNLKKRRFVSKMFKILCLLFNDMH